MAEQEDRGIQPEGTPPPKQMPFKPLQPAAEATSPAAQDEAEKPTIALKRPVLRRPGEGAPPAAVPDAAKRKTTRIELPATDEIEESEFKTVKLRPMPPPQPGSAPLPPGPKPPTPAQVQASKSKTSRISLDAAFGGDATAPASGAPKTIRLKRPTELSKGATGQVPSPVTARQTGRIPSVPPLQTSQTARLPTQQLTDVGPSAGEEEPSPTRRKTIKIKRPATAGGAHISVAASAADASADSDTPMMAIPGAAAPAVGPDTAHVTFIIAAAAALILALGVIWILAAQTFGPNAAVTGYAFSAGPDISPPPGLISIR